MLSKLKKPLLVVVSLAMATNLLLLLAAALLNAAPAPLPGRAPKRVIFSDVVGEYVMNWGGHDWDVKLRDDGYYECSMHQPYSSNKFIGGWQLSPTNQLVLTEARHGDPSPCWTKYTVNMDWVNKTGTSESGTPIKLRRK